MDYFNDPELNGKYLHPIYKITKVQPVDMFPHTHHVENVVLLG